MTNDCFRAYELDLKHDPFELLKGGCVSLSDQTPGSLFAVAGKKLASGNLNYPQDHVDLITDHCDLILSCRPLICSRSSRGHRS